MTIVTACSSSLVAIDLAILNLRGYHEMEAAVVGGFKCILHPMSFVGGPGYHMLSSQGRCFAFNENADGFSRSVAAGSIYLKPEVYVASGGLVVISASCVNHDGRSSSLTAPNGPSQVACIRRVDNEIQKTECHGMGRMLSDTVEGRSLCKAFDLAEWKDSRISNLWLVP